MINLLRRLIRSALPMRLRMKWLKYLAPEQFIVLKRSELSYAEDNLYTSNTAPFLQDERFTQAYNLGVETNSWHGNIIRWRAFIACWVSEHVASLPGDFVECGVNRGGLARTITAYIDFSRLNKSFYLIDTFTGLVPEYLTNDEREKDFLGTYAYYKENSKDHVTKTFASFPNVHVIQGWVPDVLPDVPAQQVAYLSLDMNCTMPELKAAEYFWDRMVAGGIILLDDYGQKLHSEQQLLFDQFARERQVSILALPTGQGLIFKPN